jgi:hypothetical protein
VVGCTDILPQTNLLFFRQINTSTEPELKLRVMTNLRLRARALSCLPPENGSAEPLSPYFVLSSLRASRASVTGSHVLGHLYDSARTYFQAKLG